MGLTKPLKYVLTLALLFILPGCISTQFSLVAPGSLTVGSLSLTTPDQGWNRAPEIYRGGLRDDSELWTRDGLLLDRLFIIPAVSNGGTLFVSKNEALVFPSFKQNMLPNEIVELTQSSLAKYYGIETVIETSGLRPYRLGSRRAFMFDMAATATEVPSQHGRVLAFIQDSQLYLLIYIATELHYFDKHWDAALALMQSANVLDNQTPT